MRVFGIILARAPRISATAVVGDSGRARIIGQVAPPAGIYGRARSCFGGVATLLAAVRTGGVGRRRAGAVARIIGAARGAGCRCVPGGGIIRDGAIVASVSCRCA
jgi:hypothetical protein